MPDDRVSTENMLILEATADKRWPVFIDPQEQAIAFIREHLRHYYVSIKANSSVLPRALEIALARGRAVICENVGELNGPPTLTTILGREVATIAGTKYIKLDDNEVEYNEDFRLYLFTGLANPHFRPAVQSKVKILNFSVTAEGLQAQLLTIVCKSECSKEEEEKNRL
jgi:dynein heavy chain, axonemal